ncbi:SMI1/KNR4 family protein [Bacillus haynesii]|uniref:SMI1/KNR4 family protein n=3 Tax=Bacillus haynesii TaxID=1925021 RepID=UPI00228090B1|nr:SMI1/KNR4 family protein [Bacillus haynesii]MCY8372869.1 SMI1/KNR4 family protein [Bacillus haynesii]MCY8671825.1 SMI1/KNR4 family protein [Bacillus haynesii]MEC1448294.1 SMI1/KNR4 family protein [Bacillus haynesii]MEC1473048.1 SMI1/KNR4 family protein [Bacillus haynesii]MEC1476224.1 SMI1/KNR4 family protein [Bacillus haynesii]
MYDFEFLNKYISEIDDPHNQNKKHVIYRLEDDVIEAEERLENKFPNELREFYLRVGYGFICNLDKTHRDRVMDPHSVADFLLDVDDFIDPSIRELYPENMLVFFEVGEGSYLTLDLDQEEENGICPVYYFEKKIAVSLEEFLKKMDEELDYYIHA